MANIRKPRKLSGETLRQALEQLLEVPLPLPEITNNTLVFRTEDDCDGDKGQGLQLRMGPDGDIWIITLKRVGALRFRNGMIGGTSSPHTHNALRLLMLAMMKDEKFHTQRR